MHQDIIKELYSEYQLNGYISENRIFDAVVSLKIPLDKVDVICETLLAKGVIIKDDSGDSDDSDFSQVDYELIYKEAVEIDESLATFIDEVKNIKPPQRKEWQTLYRSAQNGNDYARERIIIMNLRTVVRIALWHYKKYAIPLSEAIQDGNRGLVIALDKFDTRKHNNFSQYAAHWVRQLIMRSANPINPLIRFPAHYMDKLFAVSDVVNAHDCHFCDEYTLCPTLINEVIDKMGYGIDETIEILKHFIPLCSVQELLEKNEESLSDYGAFETHMNERHFDRELKKSIEEALDTLTEREMLVIMKRFGLDGADAMTLEQVGEEYGVTRERIRQIESKALRKLRQSHKIKSLKIFW